MRIKTPLLIACTKNYEAIIRFLIESGANVNATSERGSSPFLAICQHNNVELARLLIKHGARHDVEAKNLYDGQINGLIVAAESGSFEILKLLVEAGLDVNYQIEGKVNILIDIQSSMHYLFDLGRNSWSYTSVLCMCQRLSKYCRIFNQSRSGCQRNREGKQSLI